MQRTTRKGQPGGGKASCRRTLRRQLGVLAVAVATVFALLTGAGAASPVLEAVDTYTVVAGDTLWGIAVARVGPEQDPRAVVAAIIELNGLEGALIYPGQTLLVPRT